ncbi:MAG: prolipoprotein diacylglyceryl transferase [Oscillospiraceae bacterium]
MFAGFTVFGHLISSYSLCILAGIFAAFPIAVRRFSKRGGDGSLLMLTLVFAAIGAFLGMHLLFGLTNISHWDILTRAKGFRDFLRRFAAVFGGGVFYGGLFGGIAAGGIALKVMKLPAGLACDCLAPSIALFHAFGRVGCFLGGCCYGVESEHGIVFTDSLVESANGVPRVPVQLYEAAFELALFLALSLLLAKGKYRGKLLTLYLLVYSFGRFILEYWRGDEYRGFILGLSTSQFIGIFVFAAAALHFIFAPKAAEKSALDNPL